MADKNLLAQMLENLVNNDQAKAEELFHEYVVAKSREIYEDLIESEIEDEDDKEDSEEKPGEKPGTGTGRPGNDRPSSPGKGN